MKDISVFPFKTKTLPPASTTNTVFLGDKKLIIVDPATPYPDEQARFDKLFDSYQGQGKVFCAIVLTHHHLDHISDAVRLSKRYQLPIWAHRETAKRVDFPIDRFLDDNDEIELLTPIRLQILHTPGHAPGHICLFEKNTKTLIAGDMIASSGTILIDSIDGHLATYLASLQRLLSLQPVCVIPAHGPPLFDNGAQIAETYAHRLMRIEQAFFALPEGQSNAMPLEDLVRTIYPDLMDSQLAHMSLLSTLAFLLEQGRTKCDGERHYFWRSANSHLSQGK